MTRKISDNLSKKEARDYAERIVKTISPETPHPVFFLVVCGGLIGALFGFFPSLLIALIFDNGFIFIIVMPVTAIIGIIRGYIGYLTDTKRYNEHCAPSKVNTLTNKILNNPSLIDNYRHLRIQKSMFEVLADEIKHLKARLPMTMAVSV